MSQLFSSIGGGELFDRVIEDEFVLTERACVCFMKQILEGVSYMHHQQVIHLDLKVSQVCKLMLLLLSKYSSIHGCYHSTSDKFPGHCCESYHFHLQPENILCMTKSGNRIKIIDFGLARKFEPMRKLQVDSLPSFHLNRLSRH